MKVTFLGTGGWFATEKRMTSSVLVETKKAQFVFDAGSGFPRVWKHLNGKPVFLFLTHYHIDHVVGLFSKAGMGMPGKLTIVGQRGVKRVIERLLGTPYSPFTPKNYRFVEMAGGSSIKIGGAKITAANLVHTSPTIGYRLEAEGKAFAYCTDTQATANAARLAGKADLLVHDSSYLERERPGLPKNMNGHSTVREAALAAGAAGAKRLALFHVNCFYGKKEEKEMEKEGRAAFANCFVTRDGQTVTI